MLNDDAIPRSNDELIANIREYLSQLERYRVADFPTLDRTPGSKLLRMIALWKSVLAHRVVDLSECSLQLLQDDRIVPANILVRSVLETTACVHWLHRRIATVDSAETLEELIKPLWRASFGSRDNSSNYEAVNILTLIDQIDKEYKVVRQQYEHLSEYAHPNLKGGLMAYSDIKLPSLETKVGINPAGLPKRAFGLGDLELALLISTEVFDALDADDAVINKNIERFASQIFAD